MFPYTEWKWNYYIRFKKKSLNVYRMPLHISRYETWQPTAASEVIQPQGQSKELKCVPLFLFERAFTWTSVMLTDSSAGKGLNSETTVPPKLFSMNLLTFKQFAMVWLFQYVEVMTWSRKFTKTFALFYLAWHPVFQGIYKRVWIPYRISKINHLHQRREA